MFSKLGEKIIDIFMGVSSLVVIGLVVLLIMAMIFSIFEDTKPAEELNETYAVHEISNKYIEIWTDTETGVQYVIYCRGSGYAGMGGITPRLDKDGEVMIKE